MPFFFKKSFLWLLGSSSLIFQDLDHLLQTSKNLKKFMQIISLDHSATRVNPNDTH